MRVGRVEDGSIYHYTRADTFLNYVLPDGRLRLSAFANSMDPRERAQMWIGASVHEADENKDWPDWMGRQVEMNRIARSNAHMLCFANSYRPLDEAVQWDLDGDRGWSHAAMWTHFADRQRGVCLEFDREMFVEDFRKAVDGTAIAMAADVVYQGSGDGPVTLPNLMVERLSDATPARMLAHVVHNPVAPYFRKDASWAYEQEFRVVAINSCGQPIYVPIIRSLRRAIISPEFPPDLFPVLLQALRDAGSGAGVERIGWSPYSLTTPPFPLEDAERVEALDAREQLAIPVREPAEHTHTPDCLFVPDQIPHGEYRLSEWRMMLVRLLDRRLARCLEQYSAEVYYSFTASHMSSSFAQYMLGLPSEKPFLILNLSYHATRATEDTEGTVEVRLLRRWRDRDPELSQWFVSDLDADITVLESFRALESVVNDALSRLPSAFRTRTQGATSVVTACRDDTDDRMGS